MTIQKLKKHQDQIPYSMVARDVIQSITNPDSLAIWIYLQSLPDDWQVKEDQIRGHFDIGRTRYMAAMRQLRELGLYEIVRTKDQHNNFTGCYFQIYPFPQVSKTIPTQNSTYIKENESIKEEDSFKEDTGQQNRKRFVPPTLQECCDYCGNQKEAEKFLLYYESNGWRVGKNKMRSWESALTGWIKRSKEYAASKKTRFNDMTASDLADYWG